MKRTFKLTADIPAEIVNFGGNRGWKFVDVVLKATPALPKRLKSEQIGLQILRRFYRQSPTLETVAAPRARFTKPHISRTRDRITFTVCLNGSGLEAGSYLGNVLVEGPRGLAQTNVSITENAKNRDLAVWGAVVALIAAFAFLVLRGAASRQATATENHRRELDQALTDDTDAGRKRAAELRKPENVPKPRIRSYIRDVFKDLNWIVTTAVALAVAAGTIIGLYSANPAWGADKIASFAALVGPTFSAVGVQSVVTSLGRGVGQ